MSDVEQRIELLDGFTEPLNDLKDSIKDVLMQNDLLTESVEQGAKTFKAWGERIKSNIDDIRSTSLSINTLKSALKLKSEFEPISNIFSKGSDRAGKEFERYKGLLKFTLKEQGLAVKSIANDMRNVGVITYSGMSEMTRYTKKYVTSMSMFNKGAESYSSGIRSIWRNFADESSYAMTAIKVHLGDLRKGMQHTVIISKSAAKASASGFKKGLLGGVKYALTGMVVGHMNVAATALFKSGVNAYHRMFKKLFDSIEPYIDRIEEADKMTALFGESKAESFNNKMYMWAQQHGQNAKVVSQLGSKAAYEGIGTQHFDKLMTFADKIATLSPGKTFEDTASSLIENIKRGHDAGTISQMLGGGQLMERQLRWKGYERALRRGDIDKALAIAEKVAEQAGITDEKYKEAGESMAKNFTAIQNITENIRNRFGTEFNKQFAPAIKKIRQFMESEGFQKFINGLTTVIRLIGKGFNKAIEFAIDNIDTLGILLGVAVGTKIFLIVRQMKVWLGVAKFLFPVIKFLLGPLGKILGGMFHLIKTLGISKALVNAIGASLKRSFLSPLVIGAAVIGGALFAIHKISGIAETFPSFLAGFGTFLQNAFENLLIMLENVGKFILSIPTRIKMIGPIIRELIMKFIGWLGEKLMSINEEWGQKLMDISERGIDSAQWDKNTYKLELQKYAPREFIDSMRGVNKAMDETKTWGDLFKRTGITGLLEKIDKKLGLTLGIGDEISTNTNLIKESMDQEEELKWLKAFSDRQIGSAYNSMTSSTVNTTINGASQQVIMNLGRRDPKSVSPRAKKYA